MKTYKVVTALQETELVQADEVRMDSRNRSIDFYVEDAPVASFLGYTSFSVLEEVPPSSE